MGDAVDVKAADGIQKDEEGGGDLAPEHQGEASECDLVPEEDHKTQEPHPHPPGAATIPSCGSMIGRRQGF